MRNTARVIRTILHRNLTSTGAHTIQWTAMFLPRISQTHRKAPASGSC